MLEPPADAPENPLDNYSPFDGAPESPPVRSRAPSTSLAISEEDEIRLLEERLNILESQISTQEKQLHDARSTGSLEPPPNWPYFYPLIYYDLAEVAAPLQVFVQQAMLGWLCMSAGFSLNFLGCLTLLRAGEATDSPGSKIALSALYLFFVVPMALDLTALGVYRQMKNDSPSSLGYLKLFAFLGFSTLFQAILTLGLESSGSCGFVTMLNLFIEGHGIIGTLALVITGLLGWSTWTHYKLLTGMWVYYRGSEEGRNLDLTDVRSTIAPLIVGALAPVPRE
jgi:hypothetical protein